MRPPKRARGSDDDAVGSVPLRRVVRFLQRAVFAPAERLGRRGPWSENQFSLRFPLPVWWSTAGHLGVSPKRAALVTVGWPPWSTAEELGLCLPAPEGVDGEARDARTCRPPKRGVAQTHSPSVAEAPRGCLPVACPPKRPVRRVAIAGAGFVALRRVPSAWSVSWGSPAFRGRWARVWWAVSARWLAIAPGRSPSLWSPGMHCRGEPRKLPIRSPGPKPWSPSLRQSLAPGAFSAPAEADSKRPGRSRLPVPRRTLAPVTTPSRPRPGRWWRASGSPPGEPDGVPGLPWAPAGKPAVAVGEVPRLWPRGRSLGVAAVAARSPALKRVYSRQRTLREERPSVRLPPSAGIRRLAFYFVGLPAPRRHSPQLTEFRPHSRAVCRLAAIRFRVRPLSPLGPVIASPPRGPSEDTSVTAISPLHHSPRVGHRFWRCVGPRPRV
jgi:hypothetical protein